MVLFLYFFTVKQPGLLMCLCKFSLFLHLFYLRKTLGKNVKPQKCCCLVDAFLS